MTNDTRKRWRGPAALLVAAVVPAVALWCLPAGEAAGLDPRLKEMEKKRIAAIEKVQPSVVAVMTGGGSGVLISEDGYALTNFHVTAAARSPFMKCGLPDGVLYDAVLVGLDKVGDVALIKLLPKKPGDKFPFAKMGNSDKLRAGDWSLAMGNPFLLATDFTPTVTFGLISGVHRYQYPAGTLLEYTDCIQIDTSINPGNSGGPLFNMDGELVGINGRGSFEKRGRVNSGVGYAISINQIKNFLGQMKAGLDTDHATLGAQVGLENDDAAINKIVVKSMIDSDVARRGLEVGDQVTRFAGRYLSSPNQFKNVLGLFPRGWRVPLAFRHEGKQKDILVRLMGVQRQELVERTGGPAPGPKPPPPPKVAGKFYEGKAGFANYYFNKVEQQRLLADFRKHGDFKAKTGTWEIRTTGFSYGGGKGRRIAADLVIKDKGAKDGKNDLVTGIIDGVDYALEPLKDNVKEDELMDPPGSGGLLLAMYQYRLMLAFGPKAFSGGFSHGGTEPFYTPSKEGQWDEKEIGVVFDKSGPQAYLAEVLRTRYAGVPAKWYFSTKDGPTKGQLLGFEMEVDRDKDPCEVYFGDYKAVDGRQLPHRITVRYGNGPYAVLTVNTYKLDESK